MDLPASQMYETKQTNARKYRRSEELGHKLVSLLHRLNGTLFAENRGLYQCRFEFSHS